MEYLTKAKAMNACKRIARAGKQLQEEIQQVALAGLHHYGDALGKDGKTTGDTTILTELVRSMPKGARGNALSYYITECANVKWSDKAFDGKGGFVKKRKGEDAYSDMELATSKNWYDKEDTEAKNFVHPEKLAKALIKRLEKAQVEGRIQEEEEEVAKVLHDGLQQVLSRLHKTKAANAGEGEAPKAKKAKAA